MVVERRKKKKKNVERRNADLPWELMERILLEAGEYFTLAWLFAASHHNPRPGARQLRIHLRYHPGLIHVFEYKFGGHLDVMFSVALRAAVLFYAANDREPRAREHFLGRLASELLYKEQGVRKPALGGELHRLCRFWGMRLHWARNGVCKLKTYMERDRTSDVGETIRRFEEAGRLITTSHHPGMDTNIIDSGIHDIYSIEDTNSYFFRERVKAMLLYTSWTVSHDFLQSLSDDLRGMQKEWERSIRVLKY
jgi:hypothetical protein